MQSTAVSAMLYRLRDVEHLGMAEAAAAAPAKPAPSGIQVREPKLGEVDREAWDRLAAAAEATWQSSYAYLRLLSAKQVISRRLRLLEFYVEDAGGSLRIGQAVLLQSRGEIEFHDRLQLAPEFAHRWDEVMAEALAWLGAGAYRYGWGLCLEGPREHDLARMPGVAVGQVRPYTIQWVDFSAWSDWASYWRDISANCKRDFARGDKTPGLRMTVLNGTATLTSAVMLVREQAAMHARKGLRFRTLRVLLSQVVTALACGADVFLAYTASEGRVLSILNGAQFAGNTYYLGGAARTDANGAGWYLQLSMIKAAFERAPKGKFVLGYVDYALHDEAVGGGLLRSRRAVRASSLATSTVRFSYQG